MRKLASIRKITNIQPIEGADAIEVATVDGWKVVIKKGEFAIGDLAVYIEIDSWVPIEVAPFLQKGDRGYEFEGVIGNRLRTIKLRGQISQGLLLPLEPTCANIESLLFEGLDVTVPLNIKKWEPEIPAQLAGQVRGVFPTSLIPKTDQERIQNYFTEIQEKGGASYEVTMKLDGTSCTIFRHEGELRVCSRNLELKINEENKDNTLVAMALSVADKISDGLAFQGELMGPGIQGNREGFKQHRFFVFDVFNIKKYAYLKPELRRAECEVVGLEHVPVLGTNWKAPASVDEGLALADGPSMNHKIREGLVWKCNEDPSFSFKTISNKYLLSGGS